MSFSSTVSHKVTPKISMFVWLRKLVQTCDNLFIPFSLIKGLLLLARGVHFVAMYVLRRTSNTFSSAWQNVGRHEWKQQVPLEVSSRGRCSIWWTWTMFWADLNSSRHRFVNIRYFSACHDFAWQVQDSARFRMPQANFFLGEAQYFDAKFPKPYGTELHRFPHF